MADRPITGDTAWGTTYDAYEEIAHNSDGTMKIQTILTDAEGQFVYADVNGSPTKVYTKYLTGTLDNDDTTVVAHGITGIDNILSGTIMAFDDVSGEYRFIEQFTATSAANALAGRFSATNINITNVGANLQGNNYRIKIDYIL